MSMSDGNPEEEIDELLVLVDKQAREIAALKQGLAINDELMGKLTQALFVRNYNPKEDLTQ